MKTRPVELTIELVPGSRFDVIDIAQRIRRLHGGALDACEKVLYCSHHTTAGFLEQTLVSRLDHRREGIDPFINSFQKMFPTGAGYRHDQLHLRPELSDEQREVEPPNADAHLTFIGSGLQSCVTYRHLPGSPVYFMDLDGVYNGSFRTRTSSVVGYRRERRVVVHRIDVPVSRHAIDSISLYDERLDLRTLIDDLVSRHGVESGRVDISLLSTEKDAGLTVNEYETLLMRHDLAEVLRDPLRFVALQSRNVLRDPRSVPTKSLGYARYDLVQVLNRLLDALGPRGALLERLLSPLMALPAARRLRLKRSISLAVSRGDGDRPQVIRGRYQTPILIQWRSSARQARTLTLALHAFD